LLAYRSIELDFIPTLATLVTRKIIKQDQDHATEIAELEEELEKERNKNQGIDVKAALSFGKNIEEERCSQIEHLHIELEIMNARVKTYVYKRWLVIFIYSISTSLYVPAILYLYRNHKVVQHFCDGRHKSASYS